MTEKANRKNALIILAMALGMLMASLDNTIVSACIDKVIQDIHGFDKMTWVFTAYMLASTSTMLIFGKLSDLFGRKKFFLIGIGLFMVGSALCGTAASIEQLIAFRVVQGIGSGSIMPIAFSIIFTLFADPKHAAKLSGVMGAVFGLSSVAGPQIGTLIADHLSWRWCFYVNLPIGIASFLVLLFALSESRSDTKPKIDYAGALLLIVSTVSILLALELGSRDYGWTSPLIVGLFALGAAASALFLYAETKAAEPMLPLSIFRNRMVLGTSILCFCQGIIMFSAITYLPIFAVGVLQRSGSNSLLTPMMASLICGAILSGYLQTKFRYRTVMFGNMALGIAASLLLMNMSASTPFWQVVGIMILLGLGVIGPLMSLAQSSIATNVEAKYIGISSSVAGFWRNIGGVIGASVMAVIVNSDLKASAVEAGSRFRIPSDQLGALTNPENAIHATANLPAQLAAFLRDALGSAVSHGFILSLVAMIAGTLVSLFVGDSRLTARTESGASAGHSG